MSIQSAMRPRPCLYFDGVDDVVEVPDADHLDTASEFSIFCKAKLINHFADQGGLLSKDNSWNIYENKTGNIIAYYYAGTGGSDYVSVAYNAGSLIKDWHHIGITFSLTEGYAKLWFNGEAKQSKTLTVPTNINTHSLLIGGRGGSYSTRKYNGYIMDVIYYNCRISDEAIQRHMNYGIVESNGLVGHWPLSEGSGNTIYDKSTYTNHGTISGCEWAYKTTAKGLKVV